MEITFEPITKEQKDEELASFRTRGNSEEYNSFLASVLEQKGYVRVQHVETYFVGRKPQSVLTALKTRIKDADLGSKLMVHKDDNLGIVIIKTAA